MPITLTNSYAELPGHFFSLQSAAQMPKPSMVRLNTDLAVSLGLNPADLFADTGIEMLAGNHHPKGSTPLSMAYAGHQFGNFSPQLGDGRAVLLGEILTPSGARFDLHLKGAGRTVFSRGGDGKAVLSAVLREYLVSEAMAALGVPTTRALAAVTTGETIMRDGPEPGAVLARVASSHIRVGTFQFFYARQDVAALRALMDYTIARHYPAAADADSPPLALLFAVMQKQADLIAHWMQVGFIHGVMNTDNASIAGETIDYGPCAFLDTYHPATVFSSIDRQGRYAFANQPGIAHWNLAQFAQSLLPLIDAVPETAAEQAQAVLDGFGDLYKAAWLGRAGAKIGLTVAQSADQVLVDDLLALTAEAEADFTLTFHNLTLAVQTGDFADFNAPFEGSEAINAWRDRWQARLEGEDSAQSLAAMQAANPVYIARNHRVEAALKAANEGDLEPFETLLKVLQNPFRARPETAEYENPPRPDEIVHATFCGT